jgi:hypothetical protein
MTRWVCFDFILSFVLLTFVHYIVQGFKSVGYSNLVPVLVQAIKEQQTIIEQLRQTNEQFQQRTEQRLAVLEMVGGGERR